MNRKFHRSITLFLLVLFVFLFGRANFGQTSDGNPIYFSNPKTPTLIEPYKGVGKIIHIEGRGGPDTIIFQQGEEKFSLSFSVLLNELLNLEGLTEKKFEIEGKKSWNGNQWDLKIEKFQEVKLPEKDQPKDQDSNKSKKISNPKKPLKKR